MGWSCYGCSVRGGNFPRESVFQQQLTGGGLPLGKPASIGPGGTKTINVRLERPWQIENNASCSFGPGGRRTLKACLEWPWPIKTYVHAKYAKVHFGRTGARESEGGARQVNGQCAS